MPRGSAATQPFTLPTELVTTIASLLSTLELIRTFTICRRWHTLLTTTPSLWQRLIVNFEARPDTPLTRLVGYSRGLALELSLMDINEQHHLETVLDVLGNNMHRIRVMKIFFHDWDDVEVQMQGFVDKLIWPAPLLQVFEIAYDGKRNPYVWLPEAVFAGHAPTLRHVTLDLAFWSNGWCTAFRDVLSVCICPSGWHISDILHLFPKVQELRYCGTWLFAEDDSDSEEEDPSYGDLRSISMSLKCCQERKMEKALSLFRQANDAGVANLHLIVDQAHGEATNEIFDLPSTLSALCIGRGGQEPGMQWHWGSGVGVYVELTDVDGRVFTVGHSEAAAEIESLCGDIDSDEDEDPEEGPPRVNPHPARSLLRGLQHANHWHLVRLTLCESMFYCADWYLAQLELPQLETFTIMVVPLTQRRSSALFDCTDLVGLPGQTPFFDAPKLFALRLVCHPRLPAWSVGYVARARQTEALFEEPREVTARSVFDFLSNRLVFGRTRLGEIALESGVHLSEGFHSVAANELRSLTDDLRYECT